MPYIENQHTEILDKVVSIRMPKSLHRRILALCGKRKVSAFVKQALDDFVRDTEADRAKSGKDVEVKNPDHVVFNKDEQYTPSEAEVIKPKKAKAK